MCHRGLVECDVLLIAEGLELFGYEVGSIIHDHAVGNTKAIYDRFDEIDCCSGSRTCDGYCFNPIGEFVDYHQEIF